jgi:hypothetical protein
MLHLMRMRSLQKFAAIHASIHKHLSAEQGFYSRSNFKLNRAALDIASIIVRGTHGSCCRRLALQDTVQKSVLRFGS